MASRKILGLACLLAAPLAFASDAGAPLTVEATSMEADRAKQISVFRGEVLIEKGTIHIEADEARLRAREGEVQEGTLIGNPVVFQQHPEGEPPIAGEARRIEYDAVNRVVVLTGNAWVRQGEDEFRGETIRYDLDGRKVLATSPESAPERVRLIFRPRDNEQAAPPESGEEPAGNQPEEQR